MKKMTELACSMRNREIAPRTDQRFQAPAKAHGFVPVRAAPTTQGNRVCIVTGGYPKGGPPVSLATPDTPFFSIRVGTPEGLLSC